MARSRTKQYPARGNNNIAQCARGMVQGLEHGRDPYVEALPLHALCGIVKGKKHRHPILRIRPLEQGLTPHRRAAAHRC